MTAPAPHCQPGTELLPCPFCGSPARTDLLPHEWGPGWVQCSACECAQFMSNTIGEAVTRWNTRATPAQPAGMREALYFGTDPKALCERLLKGSDDHQTSMALRREAAAYIAALPAERPAVAADCCKGVAPIADCRCEQERKAAGFQPYYRGPAQAPSEAVAFINRRLEDLAEANALYGKDQRLGAPDKIARNDREISWLKDLRSMILTASPVSSTEGKGHD